jgi:uncharacterized C2H2 Zn-finger protein
MAVCPDCNKPFQNAAWMRKHRVKHAEATLPCPRTGCGKLFKTERAVRVHAETAHDDK